MTTLFKTGTATKYIDVADDLVKWTDGTRILEVNASGEHRFTDGTRTLKVAATGLHFTEGNGAFLCTDDDFSYTDGTRVLRVNGGALSFDAGTGVLTATNTAFSYTDGTRTLGVDASGVYAQNAAGRTELGGVSATRGSPLILDLEVTWESATGAIATVPAGELWVIDGVRTVTTEAWDGGSAQLDIGVTGTATGFISAATLTAAGTKGYAVDERGTLLWDSGNTHTIEHPLAAAASIIATVDAGSTPSEGITRVLVTGWRFAA